MQWHSSSRRSCGWYKVLARNYFTILCIHKALDGAQVWRWKVGLSLQAGGCHRTCVKGQSCLRRSGRSRLRQNAPDFHGIYMVSYSAAQAAGGVREPRGEVYSRSMLYRQWFGHCPNLAVAWPDGYFSQSAYCECKWMQIGSAGEKPGLGSIIAGCRFAH
jgi:hypothetical protein